MDKSLASLVSDQTRALALVNRALLEAEQYVDQLDDDLMEMHEIARSLLGFLSIHGVSSLLSSTSLIQIEEIKQKLEDLS